LCGPWLNRIELVVRIEPDNKESIVNQNSMDPPLVSWIVWTYRELPGFMKPKLIGINVRNLRKPIRLRRFGKPSVVTQNRPMMVT
jgi:hypothetical protein